MPIPEPTWNEIGVANLVNQTLTEHEAQVILDLLTPGYGDLAYFYLEAMVEAVDASRPKNGFFVILKRRLRAVVR